MRYLPRIKTVLLAIWGVWGGIICVVLAILFSNTYSSVVRGQPLALVILISSKYKQYLYLLTTLLNKLTLFIHLHLHAYVQDYYLSDDSLVSSRTAFKNGTALEPPVPMTGIPEARAGLTM